jgi:hypothetical protein
MGSLGAAQAMERVQHTDYRQREPWPLQQERIAAAEAKRARKAARTTQPTPPESKKI